MLVGRFVSPAAPSACSVSAPLEVIWTDNAAEQFQQIARDVEIQSTAEFADLQIPE
jgi:hypothetical protein